jgi:hypothetical protein
MWCLAVAIYLAYGVSFFATVRLRRHRNTVYLSEGTLPFEKAATGSIGGRVSVPALTT